jgi:valyl-tRNA synthetase
VDELYEQFEFGKLCEALYHFAWDEVCDWYLELAKAALSTPAAEAGPDGQVTREVLGYLLDRLLRLLHPVIPFVTEELWTALTGGASVMIAPWPGARGDAGPATEQPARDPAAEAEIASLMALVTEVRRFRSDQGLRPGQRVPAVLAGIDGTPLGAHEGAIRSLLRLAPAGDGFTPTASLQAEGVTVQLDTAAAIDVAAERRRLEKDLASARKEAEQSGRKLTNDAFLAKAPADVVAATRNRLAAAEADIDRISGRLTSLVA